MKSTKIILTCLLMVLAAAVSAQDVQSLATERVEANETPGIVIGVHQNGKTQYYTAGYADVAAKAPVDSKTLFEIGSITKTFTNILIAQQAEERKLSLDEPVQKYLPAGVTMPGMDGKSITFLDLATAHSGLPRLPANMAPADPQNPYLDYTDEKLYTFLSGYQLTRTIGSQYEYSNLGMGLLGVLAARVEGKTYRESVAARILTPLKMNRTFLNTPGQLDNNTAKGYTGNIPAKPWTWNDQSCMQGAGGLISNAADMMAYLLANMNPGTHSLGKAMAVTHLPRADAGKSDMKIGMGWHIRSDMVWHNGGTGGFRSFAGFDPKKKMAVVILTNSTTGADDLGFHLLDGSLPLKKIRKPVAVSEEILRTYVGTYEITPAFKLDVALDKQQLSIQATAQPRVDVYAETETKFFLTVVDAQVEFFKSDTGEVTKLILYQSGQALNGIKVK